MASPSPSSSSGCSLASHSWLVTYASSGAWHWLNHLRRDSLTGFFGLMISLRMRRVDSQSLSPRTSAMTLGIDSSVMGVSGAASMES